MGRKGKQAKDAKQHTGQHAHFAFGQSHYGRKDYDWQVPSKKWTIGWLRGPNLRMSLPRYKDLTENEILVIPTYKLSAMVDSARNSGSRSGFRMGVVGIAVALLLALLAPSGFRDDLFGIAGDVWQALILLMFLAATTYLVVDLWLRESR